MQHDIGNVDVAAGLDEAILDKGRAHIFMRRNLAAPLSCDAARDEDVAPFDFGTSHAACNLDVTGRLYDEASLDAA